MSEKPAPRSHTPKHLLTKFQSQLWRILEEGEDKLDGNGNVVRVTASPKFFEIAAQHLKDNDITIKSENDIAAILANMTNKPQPQLGQPEQSEDWTPQKHELSRPGDA